MKLRNLSTYKHFKVIMCPKGAGGVAHNENPDQGPVVQSIVSLTSSLRGQLVKCFMTL